MLMLEFFPEGDHRGMFVSRISFTILIKDVLILDGGLVSKSDSLSDKGW